MNYFQDIVETHLRSFQTLESNLDDQHHAIPNHGENIAYAASNVNIHEEGMLFVRLKDGTAYFYHSDNGNTQLPIVTGDDKTYGLIHNTVLSSTEILWFRYHFANSIFFLSPETYQNLGISSNGIYNASTAVPKAMQNTLEVITRFPNDLQKAAKRAGS